MNYKQYLQQKEASLCLQPWSEEKIAEEMKKEYPGDFTVRSGFSPEKGRFVLDVHFEDKKKELIWKMKYG